MSDDRSVADANRRGRWWEDAIVVTRIAAAVLAALLLGGFATSVAAGREPSLPTGRWAKTIYVGGEERNMAVEVPEGAATKPMPVVVALHGLSMLPGFMDGLGHLADTARKRRFVLVTPSGFTRSWNAGSCCGESMRDGVDDVAFLDATVNWLKNVNGIDASRIYVAGFSNGGMMALRLLCNPSLGIAGVAAIGATDTSGCGTVGHRKVLMINGSQDHTVPVAGGWFHATGDASAPFAPVATAAEALAKRSKCAAPVAGPTTGQRPLLLDWSGCAGGGTLRRELYADLAHEWDDRVTADVVARFGL